ncbi:chloride transporter, chloride channel (ClC) family [Bordetella holmesii 35009]|nr:chloride transporter, chloride channel (ClC) family [Bordetella holmesii 35009]
MFSPALRPRATFTLTVLLVGLSAGVVGLLLSMLLHAVQHLAFGYSLDDLFFSHRAFLYGVMAATPERRVMALIACGLVAGLGWGALYRWGRPLVSVKATLSDDAPPCRQARRWLMQFCRSSRSDSALPLGGRQRPEKRLPC